MSKEIEAKSILSKVKKPSGWFGVNYIFNIYRGCEHGCIYCDSRSLCYGIDNFNELIIKKNSDILLEKELKSKRRKGLMGTGSMSDPYTKQEKKYKLTRKCLEVIEKYNYPVHITTKSNMVLRDVDILQEINKIYASIAITITTSDELLARKIEPGASSVMDRFKALGVLATLGMTTSITMMPVLPFIEDTKTNILDIVDKASFYGVKYIVPFIGLTLRDRQRAYFYNALDKSFPNVRKRYEKMYGERYVCNSPNIRMLNYILREECYKKGIKLGMPSYSKKISEVQLSLFDNI